MLRVRGDIDAFAKCKLMFRNFNRGCGEYEIRKLWPSLSATKGYSLTLSLERGVDNAAGRKLERKQLVTMERRTEIENGGRAFAGNEIPSNAVRVVKRLRKG